MLDWDAPSDDFSRRKILRIGYHDILEGILFKGQRLPDCVRVVDGPGLPDDVRILAVHEDHASRSFVFVLCHPSFDVVPEGMPAPSLNGPFGLTWKMIETKRKIT